MPIILDGSKGITNASWTTASLPANPFDGQTGFNSTIGKHEWFSAAMSSWSDFSLGLGGSGLVNGATGAPSSSTFSSTATLYKVVRTLNGVPFLFDSLTFNMSTANKTAWTDPGASYKWSYVYINPVTSTFYIANSAPSIGSNSITIGSIAVVYLFAIYSNTSQFYHFYLKDSVYSIVGSETNKYKFSNDGRGNGLRMYSASSYSGLSASVNISSFIPTTALTVDVYCSVQNKMRDDTGAVYQFNAGATIQNTAGVTERIYGNDLVTYIKTPVVGGNYFPVFKVVDSQKTLPVALYNWSSVSFSNSVGGSNLYADGETFTTMFLINFVDQGVL